MTNPLANDDTYVRNMAALFAVDMRLAQRIDEAENDGAVLVEPAKRGGATAAVRPANTDKSIYLHSRIDPHDEARRWAETIQVGEDFCYIVGGFGLGYHLKALRARLRGDAFLVVTEPNLALLRAAMETEDLTDLFADDRCIILTRADKSELQTRLEPHNTLMMMGAQFVQHAASERAEGGFQAAMRKMLADHMSYNRMSLVTLVANSRITCTNIANNLPRYVSTPPIDVLRERFKGCPAIIVSAGPSLRRNIDLLADLQDKAVLCAVQTTFKPLLRRGIHPHFVTSLDYHEISRRYFEDVAPEDFERTHLVAEPKAHCDVIDAYRGPVSLLDNSFARLCLGDALAARAGLKAGATVAHLAFYLAVYMGCDPIVLVGQDLGYTNHVYYSPGVALHEMWRCDLNRFSTIEMKEWERIARFRKILMKTTDIEGRDIYTDEQLFTYLQQFEGDFATVPGRVIDATEGGVRKAGTRIMTLAEAARQYCTRPLDPKLLAYRRELNWQDGSRLSAGAAEIRRRIEEIDAMVEICGRLIDVLKQLQGLLHDPKAFDRRLAEVDALRLKVQSSERTYRLISLLSQQAELQRFSADRRIGLAELESTERARRQLDRDLRFVEAMLEGADALRNILAGSLARFEERS